MNAPTKRVGRICFADAFARAGSIDSRNGSAMVVPSPLMKVLRGSARLVMKGMVTLL
jgi:hypothetical protein